MILEKLSDPKQTIEIIKKYNFRFQKRFGQNFLIDAHVIGKIIAGAGITKEDCVLEIGPGIGTLTQYLAEAARTVIAVEVDAALIPILKETLADTDNVVIVHNDILKTDIRALADQYNDGRPLKVVANLPYYITTPIIMGLFESHVPLEGLTVMVQKEVARRMQAGPGSKDYGALSLAVQYYAEPCIVANVPCNCFIPRPNVDSAVIRLTRYAAPPVAVSDEHLMFDVIRAAFNQRRKTLVNAVSNAMAGSEKTGAAPAGAAPVHPNHFSKEHLADALTACGLPENIRGEALTLAQFAQLTDAILLQPD